jgi:hypothetical protein
VLFSGRDGRESVGTASLHLKFFLIHSLILTNSVYSS